MSFAKFDLDLDLAAHRNVVLGKYYDEWQKHASVKYGFGGRKAYAIFKEAERIEEMHNSDIRNKLIRRGIVHAVNSQMSLV